MSFIVSEAHQADPSAGEGSSLPWLQAKKEEVEEEDFTFDEPCQKKQKTSSACLGRPKALTTSEAQALRNKLDMNWDLTEVLYYVMLQFIDLIIYLLFVKSDKSTGENTGAHCSQMMIILNAVIVISS